MNPPKTLWSIGANSRIGLEIKRLWAQNTTFHLCGRNPHELERVAKDLSCRGALSTKTHGLTPPTQTEPFDLLLICLGSLSDQPLWEQNPTYRAEQWHLNTLQTIDWIEWGARGIEKNKVGHIAVMTSVAADRAKKSNYAYGASKAALDFYLQGVEHRLHPFGPRIHILKPGPTQSPMTAHMQNKKMARAEDVAKTLCRGMEKNLPLIYAPPHWQLIMKIIQLCPKALWLKTNL